MSFLGAAISATASHINTAANAIFRRAEVNREYERQKEFAQNGIRWKVEDAKAAGIHPIFAIGSNTSTYSPQAAVGLDNGIAQAGQDIGRAIEAGMTKKERSEMDALQKALLLAQIDNVNAQTEATRQNSQLRGERAIDDALRFAAVSANAVRTQQRTSAIPSTNNKQGLVDVQADTPISTGVGDSTHTAGSHPPFSYANIGRRKLASWEQNIGESLSEDIHMGAAAKLTYLTEVLSGNIKGPSHHQLDDREKRLMKNGWKWSFNPLLWSWSLNPPSSRREQWGKINR